ncbi:uncharacterized protein EV420DRAFT_1524806 [Desarmillaria tabescens]|uniref:Uncharacterized protein n=1 Tax=Armillaria tabescens TaxID=1929756 RepID=A0AA39NB77_ARMTA|nr:uncharacterized protein EV420DRAFT_1524806 [Desarmillaria tabescens]KAK0462436.1 hypothetical protein EV420DRAFT_1524806 [Desarmillaria tabescens]
MQEAVPGMELKLERLLRFYPRAATMDNFVFSNDNPFELRAAIICSGHCLFAKEHVPLTKIFTDMVSRSSKLPLRCWVQLLMSSEIEDIFSPLDPDTYDHTNKFPLDLCSATLRLLSESKTNLTQGFDSPLLLDFLDALPYFLDEFYDRVLHMFSKFVKDPSLREPSLPQSLRMVAAIIKFLLHRLSFSESDMSLYESLYTAVSWIMRQRFSSQETTPIMTILGDIPVSFAIQEDLDLISYSQHMLRYITTSAYQSLAMMVPSPYPLRDLRSMVHYMTIHWDHTLACSGSLYGVP